MAQGFAHGPNIPTTEQVVRWCGFLRAGLIDIGALD